MRIFTDKETLKANVNGKQIFIDNDFLGLLFEHEDVLRQFIELLPDCILVIDPFIELEFRRDVFLPKQRILKEEFVNGPIFLSISDEQEIYKKVRTNTLLLSQIYAHQKENDKNTASLVDLLLAARVMFATNPSLILTGNRRDFPSCIFDTIAILNLESKNGIAQPFYLVEFNPDKFNICYKSFRKLSI